MYALNPVNAHNFYVIFRISELMSIVLYKLGKHKSETFLEADRLIVFPHKLEAFICQKTNHHQKLSKEQTFVAL